MKEFEATITIRNNRLKERRTVLGMTQRQIALAIGVAVGTYNSYESLRKSPLMINGGWSPSSIAVAMYFDVPPDELWPESVLFVEATSMSRTFYGYEAEGLISSDSMMRAIPAGDAIDMRDRMQRMADREEMIVASVSKRDQGVWAMHKDGVTKTDIAEHYGVTAQRIIVLIKRIAFRIRRRVVTHGDESAGYSQAEALELSSFMTF